MANVKLVFYGSTESETSEHSLDVYANSNGQLFISIDMNMQHDYGESFIVFDKSTAIKFSKELRKQIALLED